MSQPDANEASHTADISLPDDLQARLRAAGVTDEVSLRAALDTDPQLKSEYGAERQHASVVQLLTKFKKVQTPEDMAAFSQAVHADLVKPFIDAVEHIIQLAQQWGDKHAIESLSPRLADFKSIRETQDAEANEVPMVRALRAFIYAPSETAACQIYEEHRAILQTYDAQCILEISSASDGSNIEQRIMLLRRLRNPSLIEPSPSTTTMRMPHLLAPTPSARPTVTEMLTFDNSNASIAGNLNQAQTINIRNVNVLERHWTRPTPPALSKDIVLRPDEVKEVLRLLAERSSVVISGKASAVTLRGMPGVGKTTLAHSIVLHLDAEYPYGVLWTDLQPDMRDRSQAQAILNRWAGYALGVQAQQFNFDPDAVRALLAEHPRLLVILDNVWSLDAIQPLRQALPPQTHLIVTTRQSQVAQGLGGAIHELGMLSNDEAQTLVRLRLNWQPSEDDAGVWVDELINAVGRHVLALDVALGILRQEGLTPAEWCDISRRVVEHVHRGQGFDQLFVPEGDREMDVERVLAYSYAAISEESQRRFRILGAFALDSDFTSTAAASLWHCDEQDARRQLMQFVNAALLEPRGPGLFRMHSVLRGYALALLYRQGEHDATATLHAETYLDVLRRAYDTQRFYEILPTYPQLRHAFEWAVEQCLIIALNLVDSCADIQANFGLSHDRLAWGKRVLAAAKERGTHDDIARAQNALGNALRSIATLSNEDRAVRLGEALQVFDEALRFWTPSNGPLDYAKVQHNRAIVLHELAALRKDEKSTYLQMALAAYNEALRFKRRETDPRAYAMTQHNRGNLLRDVAALPGEDRKSRLYDSLAALDEALYIRTPDALPLAYANTQINRSGVLLDLASLPEENRSTRLYAALDALNDALQYARPDTLPLVYALAQQDSAAVLSDLATLPGENSGKRLGEAIACTWEAYIVFDKWQHDYYKTIAVHNLRALRDTCGRGFALIWEQLGVGECPSWLTSLSTEEQFKTKLHNYLEQRQAAAKNEADVVGWQRVSYAGEELLATEFSDLSNVDWGELRQDLANTYYRLWVAYAQVNDFPAALTAADHAIELEPLNAMWHFNRAIVLMALGLLDEAVATLANARKLAPDSTELSALEERLATLQAQAPQEDLTTHE